MSLVQEMNQMLVAKRISADSSQMTERPNTHAKQQLVEILDAGDTPSMDLSSKDSLDQITPELLGSKESRRRQ